MPFAKGVSDEERKAKQREYTRKHREKKAAEASAAAAATAPAPDTPEIREDAGAEPEQEVGGLTMGEQDDMKRSIEESVKTDLQRDQQVRDLQQQVTDLTQRVEAAETETRQWQSGERFLAFDPALHGEHPTSKPRVEEFVQGKVSEAISSLDRAQVLELAEKHGILPDPVEIEVR